MLLLSTTKSFRKLFIQAASSVLILCFVVQDLAWAAPEIKVSIPVPQMWNSAPVFPQEVAAVQDSFRGDSGRTVYLFQDAHTNFSAQKNIASAVRQLVENEKLRTVYLEGGFGDVSLTALKKQASPQKREDVGLRYLRSGELSGAEYLNLTGAADFELAGVEDRELYWRSLELYRTVSKDRGNFKQYLSDMDRTLETLKPELLHPLLRTFDRKRQEFLDGKSSFGEYFSALKRYALWFDAPISDYPELSKVAALSELESRLDFKAANAEAAKAARFIEERKPGWLASVSGKSEAGKLTARNARNAEAFYALLAEELKGLGAPDYPALDSYFDYLKHAVSVKPAELLREEGELERVLLEKLAASPDEKTMLDAADRLRQWQALIGLSLLPDEFQALSGAEALDLKTLTGFLNKKIEDLDDHYDRVIFLNADFEKALDTAEEFYALTKQRDELFVERMLAHMAEKGETKAALIAGGYHSPNLKALLKEKGVSFVCVTPQVLNETNVARYEKLLLGQRPSAVPAKADALALLAVESRPADSPALNGARLSLELSEGAQKDMARVSLENAVVATNLIGKRALSPQAHAMDFLHSIREFSMDAQLHAVREKIRQFSKSWHVPYVLLRTQKTVPDIQRIFSIVERTLSSEGNPFSGARLALRPPARADKERQAHFESIQRALDEATAPMTSEQIAELTGIPAHWVDNDLRILSFRNKKNWAGGAPIFFGPQPAPKTARTKPARPTEVAERRQKTKERLEEINPSSEDGLWSAPELAQSLNLNARLVQSDLVALKLTGSGRLRHNAQKQADKAAKKDIDYKDEITRLLAGIGKDELVRAGIFKAPPTVLSFISQDKPLREFAAGTAAGYSALCLKLDNFIGLLERYKRFQEGRDALLLKGEEAVKASEPGALWFYEDDIYKKLEHQGIGTIGQLSEMTPSQLMAWKSVKPEEFRAMVSALRDFKLSFAREKEPISDKPLLLRMRSSGLAELVSYKAPEKAPRPRPAPKPRYDFSDWKSEEAVAGYILWAVPSRGAGTKTMERQRLASFLGADYGLFYRTVLALIDEPARFENNFQRSEPAIFSLLGDLAAKWPEDKKEDYEAAVSKALTSFHADLFYKGHMLVKIAGSRRWGAEHPFMVKITETILSIARDTSLNGYRTQHRLQAISALRYLSGGREALTELTGPGQRQTIISFAKKELGLLQKDATGARLAEIYPPEREARLRHDMLLYLEVNAGAGYRIEFETESEKATVRTQDDFLAFMAKYPGRTWEKTYTWQVFKLRAVPAGARLAGLKDRLYDAALPAILVWSVGETVIKQKLTGVASLFAGAFLVHHGANLLELSWPGDISGITVPLTGIGFIAWGASAAVERPGAPVQKFGEFLVRAGAISTAVSLAAYSMQAWGTGARLAVSADVRPAFHSIVTSDAPERVIFALIADLKLLSSPVILYGSVPIPLRQYLDSGYRGPTKMVAAIRDISSAPKSQLLLLADVKTLLSDPSKPRFQLLREDRPGNDGQVVPFYVLLKLTSGQTPLSSTGARLAGYEYKFKDSLPQVIRDFAAAQPKGKVVVHELDYPSGHAPALTLPQYGPLDPFIKSLMGDKLLHAAGAWVSVKDGTLDIRPHTLSPSSAGARLAVQNNMTDDEVIERFMRYEDETLLPEAFDLLTGVVVSAAKAKGLRIGIHSTFDAKPILKDAYLRADKYGDFWYYDLSKGSPFDIVHIHNLFLIDLNHPDAAAVSEAWNPQKMKVRVKPYGVVFPKSTWLTDEPIGLDRGTEFKEILSRAAQSVKPRIYLGASRAIHAYAAIKARDIISKYSGARLAGKMKGIMLTASTGMATLAADLLTKAQAVSAMRFPVTRLIESDVRADLGMFKLGLALNYHDLTDGVLAARLLLAGISGYVLIRNILYSRQWAESAALKIATGLFIGGSASNALETAISGGHGTNWFFIASPDLQIGAFMNLADLGIFGGLTATLALMASHSLQHKPSGARLAEEGKEQKKSGRVPLLNGGDRSNLDVSEEAFGVLWRGQEEKSGRYSYRDSRTHTGEGSLESFQEEMARQYKNHLLRSARSERNVLGLRARFEDLFRVYGATREGRENLKHFVTLSQEFTDIRSRFYAQLQIVRWRELGAPPRRGRDRGTLGPPQHVLYPEATPLLIYLARMVDILQQMEALLPAGQPSGSGYWKEKLAEILGMEELRVFLDRPELFEALKDPDTNAFVFAPDDRMAEMRHLLEDKDAINAWRELDKKIFTHKRRESLRKIRERYRSGRSYDLEDDEEDETRDGQAIRSYDREDDELKGPDPFTPEEWAALDLSLHYAQYHALYMSEGYPGRSRFSSSDKVEAAFVIRDKWMRAGKWEAIRRQFDEAAVLLADLAPKLEGGSRNPATGGIWNEGRYGKLAGKHARLRHFPERAMQTVVAPAAYAHLWTQTALRNDMRFAEISQEPGTIELKAFRNPLIERGEVEPIDISLSSKENALLLTGPNMGGKTSTARSVGLAVFLNQLGLPVPAKEARLGVFNRVLTVFPREEQLQAGYGYFAALVKHVTNISREAKPGDLVILDEVPNGTDYQELVAVTVVLLEDLIKTGATVVVTGHLKKAFELVAHSTGLQPRMQGVERRGAALVQSRRLRPGIAENSHAIDLMEKAEFPPEVIESARQYYAAITGTRPEALTFKREKVERGGNAGEYESAHTSLKRIFENIYTPNFFAMEDSAEILAKEFEQDIKRTDWKSADKNLAVTAGFVSADDKDLQALTKALARFSPLLPKNRPRHWGTRTEEEIKREEIERLHKHIDFLKNLIEHAAFLGNDPRTAVYPRYLRRTLHKAEHAYSEGDYSHWQQFWETKVMEDVFFLDRHAGMARAIHHHKLQAPIFTDEPNVLSIHESRPLFPNYRFSFYRSEREAGEPFVKGAVPQDIDVDPAAPRIVLTGPNSSGKSVAMMNAYANTMFARAGYFVSGEVTLSRFTQVYNFFGGRNRMGAGESYFFNILNQYSNILKEIEPGSLVILDELHGTDNFELAAIQLAILHHLSTKKDVTVLFNTHIRDGLKSLGDSIGLRFWKTNIDFQDGKVKPRYTLSLDPDLEAKSYGLAVAAAAGLTLEQFQRTREVYREISGLEAPEVEYMAPEAEEKTAAPDVLSAVFDRDEIELALEDHEDGTPFMLRRLEPMAKALESRLAEVLPGPSLAAALRDMLLYAAINDAGTFMNSKNERMALSAEIEEKSDRISIFIVHEGADLQSERFWTEILEAAQKIHPKADVMIWQKRGKGGAIEIEIPSGARLADVKRPTAAGAYPLIDKQGHFTGEAVSKENRYHVDKGRYLPAVNVLFVSEGQEGVDILMQRRGEGLSTDPLSFDWTSSRLVELKGWDLSSPPNWRKVAKKTAVEAVRSEFSGKFEIEPDRLEWIADEPSDVLDFSGNWFRVYRAVYVYKLDASELQRLNRITRGWETTDAVHGWKWMSWRELKKDVDPPSIVKRFLNFARHLMHLPEKYFNEGAYLKKMSRYTNSVRRIMRLPVFQNMVERKEPDPVRNVFLADNEKELGNRFSIRFVETARSVLHNHKRPRFKVVIPGGGIPKEFRAFLTSPRLFNLRAEEWKKIHIYVEDLDADWIRAMEGRPEGRPVFLKINNKVHYDLTVLGLWNDSGEPLPFLPKSDRTMVVVTGSEGRRLELFPVLKELDVLLKDKPRVEWLASYPALLWKRTKFRRKNREVTADIREGTDPAGPVSIFVPGFTGIVTAGMLLKDLPEDWTVAAVHRTSAPHEIEMRSREDLLYFYAKDIAAAVRHFNGNGRHIGLVAHSDGTAIVNHLFGNPDDHPDAELFAEARKSIRSIVLVNPYMSYTRLDAIKDFVARHTDRNNGKNGLGSLIVGIVIQSFLRLKKVPDDWLALPAGSLDPPKPVVDFASYLTHSWTHFSARLLRGRLDQMIGKAKYDIEKSMIEVGVPLALRAAIMKEFKDTPFEALLAEFRAVLSYSSEIDQLAIERIKELGIKIVIVVNEDDPISRVTAAQRYAETLRSKGVEVVVHVIQSDDRAKLLGNHISHFTNYDIVNPIIVDAVRSEISAGARLAIKPTRAGKYKIGDVSDRILSAYTEYYREDERLTEELPLKRFLDRDWTNIEADQRQRVILFSKHLDEVREWIRKAVGEQRYDQKYWARLRNHYWKEVENQYDADLARTFFYAVMRRILSEKEGARSLEFTDDGIQEPVLNRPAVAFPYKSYTRSGSTRDMLLKVFNDLPFKMGWHLDRAIELGALRLERRLGVEALENGRLEILSSVFFRNKGAYIMGRLVTASGKVIKPVVFAFENRTDEGPGLHAILTDYPVVNGLFNSSRANFRVMGLRGRYREIIDFLHTILPERDAAVVYSAIGFLHPGKIRFLHRLREYLKKLKPGDEFQKTSGREGTLMLVMRIPGFPFVFKIIREKSLVKEGLPPKGLGNPHDLVVQKYRMAHERDRVGRKLDAMKFYRIAFKANQFSDELLEEFRRDFTTHVTISPDPLTGEEMVVFEDLYVQREVVPLDIFLRSPEVSLERKVAAFKDLARCIKEIAQGGIYMSDMRINNFGVTLDDRVVSYDHDDMIALEEVGFIDWDDDVRRRPLEFGEKLNIMRGKYRTPDYILSDPELKAKYEVKDEELVVVPEEELHQIEATAWGLQKDMKDKIFGKALQEIFYEELFKAGWWEETKRGLITRHNVAHFYPYHPIDWLSAELPADSRETGNTDTGNGARLAASNHVALRLAGSAAVIGLTTLTLASFGLFTLSAAPIIAIAVKIGLFMFFTGLTDLLVQLSRGRGVDWKHWLITMFWGGFWMGVITVSGYAFIDLVLPRDLLAGFVSEGFGKTVEWLMMGTARTIASMFVVRARTIVYARATGKESAGPKQMESFWVARVPSYAKNFIIQMVVPVEMSAAAEAVATQFFQLFYSWSVHKDGFMVTNPKYRNAWFWMAYFFVGPFFAAARAAGYFKRPLFYKLSWKNPEPAPAVIGFGEEAFARAQRTVLKAALRTPLEEAPRLSALLGKRVFVKREDLQPSGSFKSRGVYNQVENELRGILERAEQGDPAALGILDEGVKIVTQSTGNHGAALVWSVTQAIRSLSLEYPAYADRLKDVEPVIFSYAGLKPAKRTAMWERMKEYHAEYGYLNRHGLGKGQIFDTFSNYAEAKEKRVRFVEENNGAARYMDHGGRDIMLGHGSMGIEIAEQLAAMGIPEGKKAVLFLPVGEGGPLGIAAAIKQARPNVTVVLVQAEGLDALVHSLVSGQPETNDKSWTEPDIADGIAVDAPDANAAPMAKAFTDAAYSIDEREAKAPLRAALSADLGAQPGGTTLLTAAAASKFRNDAPVRDADYWVFINTEKSASSGARLALQDIAVPALPEPVRFEAEARLRDYPELFDGDAGLLKLAVELGQEELSALYEQFGGPENRLEWSYTNLTLTRLRSLRKSLARGLDRARYRANGTIDLTNLMKENGIGPENAPFLESIVVKELDGLLKIKASMYDKEGIARTLESKKGEIRGKSMKEIAAITGIEYRKLMFHLRHFPENVKRFGLRARLSVPQFLEDLHRTGQLKGLTLSQVGRLYDHDASALSRHFQAHDGDYEKYGVTRPAQKASGARLTEEKQPAVPAVSGDARLATFVLSTFAVVGAGLDGQAFALNAAPGLTPVYSVGISGDSLQLMRDGLPDLRIDALKAALEDARIQRAEQKGRLRDELQARSLFEAGLRRTAAALPAATSDSLKGFVEVRLTEIRSQTGNEADAADALRLLVEIMAAHGGNYYLSGEERLSPELRAVVGEGTLRNARRAVFTLAKPADEVVTLAHLVADENESEPALGPLDRLVQAHGFTSGQVPDLNALLREAEEVSNFVSSYAANGAIPSAGPERDRMLRDLANTRIPSAVASFAGLRQTPSPEDLDDYFGARLASDRAASFFVRAQNIFTEVGTALKRMLMVEISA